MMIFQYTINIKRVDRIKYLQLNKFLCNYDLLNYLDSTERWKSILVLNKIPCHHVAVA